VTALAAVLVAAAVALSLSPPPEPRLRLLLAGTRAPSPSRRAITVGFASTAAGILAAIGIAVSMGGPLGIGLAVACAIGVPRLMRRLETRGARRLREQLARQAPVVADLLAATVASGSPMRAALAGVGEAVGDPAHEALRPVMAEIDLGADPAHAWRALTLDRAMGPIASSVVRSMETGAPLSAVLARIAEDMRRDRQVAVEVAARAAGVKAVAPLAACFLPAFLLLGVVPVVASLAADLLST
jgi:Flp pilus assembly protein TadB